MRHTFKNHPPNFHYSIACQHANFVVISSQLKRMMADCPKMTYGGIKYTIWYIANHAGKDVSISHSWFDLYCL